ncbi:hypothetical protein Tco_0967934 [Tanacetum coccineum]
MKRWEELIRKNVFGLGGHLSASLAHMLYCIVAEEQYNLAYFFVKRVECARGMDISQNGQIQSKTDKTEHGNGKSARKRSQSRNHLKWAKPGKSIHFHASQVLLEDLADTSDTLHVHAGNPLCCDWLRNVAHDPMDEIDGYEAVWIEGTRLKEWRSVSGSRSFCS